MPRSRVSPWTQQLILVAFMIVAWLAITVLAVQVGGNAPLRPGEQARHAYWMAAYFAPCGYLLLLAIYICIARRIRGASD